MGAVKRRGTGFRTAIGRRADGAGACVWSGADPAAVGWSDVMRPEGRSSGGQRRGCSSMSSRLRLRPIGALASATIEPLHLLFRHHLVKRQRRGLKIVFRYMRRLEVAIAIFAAYQRGPIPRSPRLLP